MRRSTLQKQRTRIRPPRREPPSPSRRSGGLRGGQYPRRRDTLPEQLLARRLAWGRRDASKELQMTLPERVLVRD